jgi:hypothetical protein
MKIAPSVLALLLVHSSAFAEPDDVVITDDAPKTCGPALGRVPKSVRRAVQAWLDAQDDLDEADARAEDARDKATAKLAPEGDAPGSPDFAPPGTVEPTQIDGGAPRTKPASRSWFALAGVAGTGRGLRMELDLATRDHWVVGASGTIASDRYFNQNGFVSDGSAYLSPIIDMVDARAMVTVARDMGDGPWRLRSSIGAGFVYTQSTAMYEPNFSVQPMQITATGVFPVAEATITVEHDLGDNWGIEAGMLTTVFDQTLHITQTDVLDRGPLQFMVLGGLRHRI